MPAGVPPVNFRWPAEKTTIMAAQCADFHSRDYVGRSTPIHPEYVEESPAQ
jgi:hypothetical protein